jgi:hypothetical protein
MCQKSWLLASALATIAAFGGGLGAGFFWATKGQTPVEAAPRPDPGNAKANSKPAPPDGVRLERLQDAEGLLESAGQPTVMLKFSGNRYLKFWAELETNGETRQVLESTSRPMFEFAGPIPHNEGDFVWLRARTETPGVEAWRMATRGKNAWSGGSTTVHLFDRPGKATIKSYGTMQPESVLKIPELLPLDRAVCLKEVREISDHGERALVASNAGLIGSAASANPLATCAALVAPKTAGICTIRLMCKAYPEDVAPGK